MFGHCIINLQTLMITPLFLNATLTFYRLMYKDSMGRRAIILSWELLSAQYIAVLKVSRGAEWHILSPMTRLMGPLLRGRAPAPALGPPGYSYSAFRIRNLGTA